MSEQMTKELPHPDLGENIARLRAIRGWNLSELAKFSGLPQSTLSKVESGKMSLNYNKLLTLAAALKTDIRNLFATDAELAALDGQLARRTFNRAGDSASPKAQEDHYHVTYLSTELKNRLMIPMLFEVQPGPKGVPFPTMNIIGERFAYVIKGPVEFHCNQYETITLEQGDSVYVDAAMPHAFVSPTKETALVISVLASSNMEYLDLAKQVASEGQTDATNIYEGKLNKR